MNVKQAHEIAQKAHHGVLDKGGVPYIEHPNAVARASRRTAEVYFERGGSLVDTVEVVAQLHDVVEDTDWTLEQLVENGLTPLQAEALDAITQRESDGTKERYSDYIRRCGENSLAKIVKIADLKHNLSPERLDKLPPDKQTGLRKRYNRALAYLEGGYEVF